MHLAISCSLVNCVPSVVSFCVPCIDFCLPNSSFSVFQVVSILLLDLEILILRDTRFASLITFVKILQEVLKYTFSVALLLFVVSADNSLFLLQEIMIPMLSNYCYTFCFSSYKRKI